MKLQLKSVVGFKLNIDRVETIRDVRFRQLEFDFGNEQSAVVCRNYVT